MRLDCARVTPVVGLVGTRCAPVTPGIKTFTVLDMDQRLRRLYQFLLLLSCLSMIGALAAIALNILTRLIDGWSIDGLDGYAGYAIASALFLALPSAFFNGDHIRVGILVKRTSGRVRAALDYWVLILGLGLSSYMAWFAARLVWQSYVFHDVAPTGDATPMWIPQLTMAVGCAGFALAMGHALLLRWRQGELVMEANPNSTHGE